MIGSIFEWNPIKSASFDLFHPLSHFTDDTVLTIATARAILRDEPFESVYREFGLRYPRAGYGSGFRDWLHGEAPESYRSFGNGSAMRVSPVGFAYDNERDVLAHAERSAEITHGHPEGIKGAQAVALAVFNARTGTAKEAIRDRISSRFGYDLDRSVDDIRPHYAFDVTCQGSVPEAIVAFLDSRNVEDAIRLAVSLGGDSDTQACIAGAIAHAYYREIPHDIATSVRQRLPQEFLDVIDEFRVTYNVP